MKLPGKTIVHIQDYYQPQIGYQAPHLAKAHKKLGYKVFVITANRYFPFSNYKKNFFSVLGKRKLRKGKYQDGKITVYRLSPYIEYTPSAFVFCRGVKKVLEKIKPDIVVSHDILSPQCYIAAVLKNKIGYKLIYDNHAAAFNTNLKKGVLKKTYLFFWKKFIRPKILKYADKIIAIGEEELKLSCHLLNIPRDKIKILYLGVDIDNFKIDKKKGRKIREKLKIKEEEKVLIHAGKLAPNKETHLLIHVFSDIINKEKIKNLKLIIIGGGEEGYIRRLKNIMQKNKLENKIKFLSFVKNNSLFEYFNAADIGVWPGNPSQVFFEAIACGLPIIVEKKPYSDKVTANDNGINIERGNKEKLKYAILRLIKNDKLLSKMSKKSRDLACKKFSWDKIAKEFIK